MEPLYADLSPAPAPDKIYDELLTKNPLYPLSDGYAYGIPFNLGGVLKNRVSRNGVTQAPMSCINCDNGLDESQNE
eukprot:Awhi_evm1s15073